MKNRENGVGLAAVLAAVVIVGLIGAAGWLVYDRHQSKKNDGQTNSQTNSQASQQTPAKKTPEDSNKAETAIKEEYTASASKGTAKLEINPSSGVIGTTVKYRLTGLTYALEDNLQIFFVDSAGHNRSLAAFAMTNTREDSLRIPEKVFACELGQNCTTEVATAKGIGKLVVTHSNNFVVDISIDLEVK
jgi:cytoskeletal protein RodZ